MSLTQRISYIVIAIIFYCCDSSDDTFQLEHKVQGDNNIHLVFEDDDHLSNLVPVVVKATNAANLSLQEVMPIDDIAIQIMVGANQVILEFGFAGYNTGPNDIVIYVNPSFNGLTQSLERELPGIIAHEMHHAKRQRSIGYGNTLFQAIISEGLADHFSLEVIGSNLPPWSTAVTGTQLQELTELASQDWDSIPYDFGKWFFGTTTEVPVWTGYSIGYDLVDKFLTKNPTLKPSTLYDEPAASFSP